MIRGLLGNLFGKISAIDIREFSPEAQAEVMAAESPQISKPQSHNSVPKYMPAIDRLRAFAVLAVLLVHFPGVPAQAPRHAWLLAVTWSPAVEEQFYITWPLIVWLCSRKRLRAIAAALFLVSPLIRFGLSHVTYIGNHPL